MPKRKKGIIINIGWTIARKVAALGIIWPFVFIYRKVIKEVRPKTGKVSSDKLTLLALNSFRFRGDLEILADSREFRVLKIHLRWQARIQSLFLTRRVEFSEHYNPNDEFLIRMQKELQTFLEKFLSSL